MVPAQLPPDVTGFTGRRAHLKTLDGLLPDVDGPATAVAISAIAGLAGVGKTALAVHWGHRVRAHFPDGQLYVDLRGHAAGPPMSAHEALTHLLRSLGVPPEEIPADGDLAAGRYRSVLAQRRVLVVLDNAADAEQVRPLLPAGPGSMVLVTSRNRLHRPRRPGRCAAAHPRRARPRRGAAAADPGPRRGPGRRGAGRRRRTRAGVLVPAAGAADRRGQRHHPRRVEPRRPGAGGPRRPALAALEVAGDERASVRRAFDLSYEVLPPGARRLFRLLGVVVGPEVGAEAAAALAATTPDRAADDLDRLAAAHLVHQTAPGRYACHDLLRHFAAERAGDEEQNPSARQAAGRLSDWYLHCGDAAARLLYPHRLRLPVPPIEVAAPTPFDDPAGALAWLDAERTNLVATIRQAAEHGPRPTAWLLADTIRPYFWLRVHTTDWADTARFALAAARAEGDAPAEVAGLLSLGDTADRQNRREEAIEHYARARALAEEIGWVDALTAALGKLGSLLLESGRLRESADHYRLALAHNADGGSPHARAVVLGSLGSIHFQLGELDEASEYYTRTLALFREIGSRQGEAATLDALGEVRHAQGRLAEATAHLTAALKLEREIGDRGTEASSLRTLAAVHRDGGQTARAVELANAVVALAADLDDRRLEAEAHHILGTVRHRVGRYWDAIDNHHHALDLSRRTGYRYTEVEALLGVAAAHAGLGEHGPARQHAERAWAIAEEIGFERLAGRARAILRDLE